MVLYWLLQDDLAGQQPPTVVPQSEHEIKFKSKAQNKLIIFATV